MEKFIKESLNADECMEDMRYWIKGEAVAYLREIVPMTVWAMFVTIPALFDRSVIAFVFLAIYWAPALAYIIGASCFLIPHAIRLKKRAFAITEDTLTGTSDAVNRKGGRFHLQWKFFVFHPLIAWLLRNKYRHHYFHFEEYGRYESKYLCPIRTVRGEKSMGYNFVWSKYYRMEDTSLSQACHSGDKFYLLTYETGIRKKKTKVAFIYPQKFFEWEDR